MRKPDFFIVGAPRCGTTSLHNYLEQHPEIAIPAKDVYFFGSDLISHPLLRMKRVRTKEEYAKFFIGRSESLLGERSVWLLYSEKAAEEIKNFVSYAKILIMLRNPIEMIMSLHQHFVVNGVEDILDLSEALDAESDRKLGMKIPRYSGVPAKLFLYSEIAKFSIQVERYLKVFGTHRVYIILFDDFVSQTIQEYRKVLQFLGVDDKFKPEIKKLNPRKELKYPLLAKLYHKRLLPRKIRSAIIRWNRKNLQNRVFNEQIKNRLRIMFEEEIMKLSKLIDRDLTHWLE